MNASQSVEVLHVVRESRRVHEGSMLEVWSSKGTHRKGRRAARGEAGQLLHFRHEPQRSVLRMHEQVWASGVSSISRIFDGKLGAHFSGGLQERAHPAHYLVRSVEFSAVGLRTLVGACDLVEATEPDHGRAAILRSLRSDEPADRKSTAGRCGKNSDEFAALHASDERVVAAVIEDIVALVTAVCPVTVDCGNGKVSSHEGGDESIRSSIWAREENEHTL